MTTPEQAFLDTWNNWFKRKTATLPSDRTKKLYYYKPGTTIAKNNEAQTLQEFFTKQTGHCLHWVRFLWSVTGKQNGALQCKKIKVSVAPAYQADGFKYFLVKNWVDRRPQNLGMTTWWFRFPGKKRDMVVDPPPQDPLVFGDVKNDVTGLPGQNSKDPQSNYDCPSQKVFHTHYLFRLESNGTLYDPSYGQVYPSQQEFEASLFALGKTNEQGQIATKSNRFTLELNNSLAHPWVNFEPLNFEPGEAL
jgi:hypothetical protein